MFSYVKVLVLFLVLTSTNLFSDCKISFSNPTVTPSDKGPPNLSNSGQDACNPQIATDSTGRYVYSVWQREDDSNKKRVQIARSEDNGKTFSNPTSTPADDKSPNLSNSGQNAYNPQIATDSTGQYVYVVWQRFAEEDRTHELPTKQRVQIARSLDYGKTFSNPEETPADDGSPNLSEAARDAYNPQVVTDITGRYVYVVWQRFDEEDVMYGMPSRQRIQIARSKDHGKTFSHPKETPADDGSPNLSEAARDAYNPQIAIDSTGRYVYVVWQREDEEITSRQRIQVARSLDYGKTFSHPEKTPADDGLPNLSLSKKNAFRPQITTDKTGRYVYVVWEREDASNNLRIQVAISEDYGKTFFYPEKTSADDGFPNLSNSGEDASKSQITTDKTGRYVYVVWQRTDASNKQRIQMVRSKDHGKTFSNPERTPADDELPNLSYSGQNAFNSQIITNSNGRYIYIVWQRVDDLNKQRIQVAVSQDYGKIFLNPQKTPGGKPNLSYSGEGAYNSQITTDSSGRYAYAVWNRFDGEKNIIQVAIGKGTGHLALLIKRI